METHVNCPKCHAEIAADIEKCPKDGTELPRVGAAELFSMNARLADLRRKRDAEKVRIQAEIDELEKHFGTDAKSESGGATPPAA